MTATKLCRKGHPQTEENVYFKDGISKRCRVCHNINRAASKFRLKNLPPDEREIKSRRSSLEYFKKKCLYSGTE